MSSKKYYIYKCDDCGHEWRAPASPQPIKCPECGSENFHIHAEVSTPWFKVLIFIVLLTLIGVGSYFVYNILNKPKIDDLPPPLEPKMYILKYNTNEDGVIKITTDPEGLNYDSLDFSFRSNRSGQFIKRIDDKLYPCVGGSITFTYNKMKNVIVEEDEIMGDYKFTEAHPDSDCRKEIVAIIAKVKHNKKACTYIVDVINKNKFKDKTFEYSWNNQNKWESSNVKSVADLGDLNSVSVRIKNNAGSKVNAINTPLYPNCIIKECDDLDKITSSFNKYKSNLDDFDAYDSFVALEGEGSVKIYLNGKSYSTEKFAMNMQDKLISQDSKFGNPAKLKVTDVVFDTNNCPVKIIVD